MEPFYSILFETSCHAPGLFCCVFAPHVLPVTQFLPSLIVELFPGVSHLPPWLSCVFKVLSIQLVFVGYWMSYLLFLCLLWSMLKIKKPLVLCTPRLLVPYSSARDTSICQFNSSKCSPIMPDEVREHLTRDQRPFLHPESLQILQIHSSSSLQVTSLMFYRV